MTTRWLNCWKSRSSYWRARYRPRWVGKGWLSCGSVLTLVGASWVAGCLLFKFREPLTAGRAPVSLRLPISVLGWLLLALGPLSVLAGILLRCLGAR